VEKSSTDEKSNMVDDDMIWSSPLIMARGIVSKDNLDLFSREHFYGEEGNHTVYKWCCILEF
jgi:hypothetical protein